MPSSSPGIVIHLEFTLEIIKQPGIKVQDIQSSNMAQEGKVHVCCGELPTPPLPGVLHTTLHVLACHRAILGSQMILWEVTEVFVVELESLVSSQPVSGFLMGDAPGSLWMSPAPESLGEDEGDLFQPSQAQGSHFQAWCLTTRLFLFMVLQPGQCWQRAPDPPPSPAWTTGKIPSSASISAEGELFFPSSLPAMPSRKTKRHC